MLIDAAPVRQGGAPAPNQVKNVRGVTPACSHLVLNHANAIRRIRTSGSRIAVS